MVRQRPSLSLNRKLPGLDRPWGLAYIIAVTSHLGSRSRTAYFKTHQNRKCGFWPKSPNLMPAKFSRYMFYILTTPSWSLTMVLKLWAQWCLSFGQYCSFHLERKGPEDNLRWRHSAPISIISYPKYFSFMQQEMWTKTQSWDWTNVLCNLESAHLCHPNLKTAYCICAVSSWHKVCGFCMKMCSAITKIAKIRRSHGTVL